MVSVVKRNRKLESEDDVFNHNAWDDTQWTDDMIQEAERKIQLQREDSRLVGDSVDHEKKISNVENELDTKWDHFYQTHGDKFFKDRQWIFSEFPEILASLKHDYGPSKILEVGCGVGNAVAHIVTSNLNPNLHIYSCDLSPSAIQIFKQRDFYLNHNDKITAFAADISKDSDEPIGQLIQESSLDFITLIFTLSALKPEVMKRTVAKLSTLLKPGGLMMFRDYAQYDLTQLRFKGKSYLRDNYYVRADGTTSYFFTTQLVDEIFTSANLVQIELKQDNRLLVNRLKALKMCRCWIQAKYQKI